MATGTLALEPLELLDLRRRRTVGSIVDGLSKCAFGARMLGEVARQLLDWVSSPATARPVVVTGRSDRCSEFRVLRPWTNSGWIKTVINPVNPKLVRLTRQQRVLVLGALPETSIQELEQSAGQIIYINPYGLAGPANIQDGYFPNLVVADPAYVLPILDAYLREHQLADPTSAWQLIQSLDGADGLAGKVAGGFNVFRAMVEDQDAHVFLTMSGAMTVAQLGWVVCEMLDRGWVQLISSTGALMAHGLVQGLGLKHFKHRPGLDDAALAAEKINRVTDTWEPESNFDHVESVVSEVLDQFDGSEPISPSIFHQAIGAYLAEHYPHERGILKSAYERKVPVLVPAFVDSELGNDMMTHNWLRQAAGRARIMMDLELDSELLLQAFTSPKRVGVFSIGGGVPRNNIQNVAPLIEIINDRTGRRLRPTMFDYGVRICPDPMYIGHLSGCTYAENKSWRKFAPQAKTAEIQADATLVWPFLVRAMMDLEDNTIT